MKITITFDDGTRINAYAAGGLNIEKFRTVRQKPLVEEWQRVSQSEAGLSDHDFSEMIRAAVHCLTGKMLPRQSATMKEDRY